MYLTVFYVSKNIFKCLLRWQPCLHWPQRCCLEKVALCQLSKFYSKGHINYFTLNKIWFILACTILSTQIVLSTHPILLIFDLSTFGEDDQTAMTSFFFLHTIHFDSCWAVSLLKWVHFILTIWNVAVLILKGMLTFCTYCITCWRQKKLHFPSPFKSVWSMQLLMPMQPVMSSKADPLVLRGEHYFLAFSPHYGRVYYSGSESSNPCF